MGLISWLKSFSTDPQTQREARFREAVQILDDIDARHLRVSTNDRACLPGEFNAVVSLICRDEQTDMIESKNSPAVRVDTNSWAGLNSGLSRLVGTFYLTSQTAPDHAVEKRAEVGLKSCIHIIAEAADKSEIRGPQ